MYVIKNQNYNLTLNLTLGLLSSASPSLHCKEANVEDTPGGKQRPWA